MCNITVTLAEQRTDSIFVKGTATNCKRVSVTISDSHESIATIDNIIVDTSGNWNITFPFDEFPELETIYCPTNSLDLEIHCDEDPSCSVHDSFTINCKPPSCPSVSITSSDPTECDINGQRTVTLDIIISNIQNQTTLLIDYGDDSTSSINTAMNGTLTMQKSYNPGHYNLTVSITAPDDCVGSIASFDINIDDCQENADCPSVIITSADPSACNDNGQSTVTFEINVINPPNPTILQIDYGDGTRETVFNSEIQESTSGTITKSHTYYSGNFSVIVNTIYPEGCQSSNAIQVDVSCDISCPDNINFEIIDANGNRFQALSSASGPYQQINNNPDNNQIDCLPAGDYTIKIVEPHDANQGITWREDENPSVTTNQLSFNVHLNSGNEKTLNATIEKVNCAPLSESITIKACGGDCEETEWSEWSKCIDCNQTRERTLEDCSTEKDSKKCKNKDTSWSGWFSSFLCSISRTRLDEDCNETTMKITSWCCVWLIINIVLTVASIVALIIAGCVLQWTEPISISIAISLVIITLISWILWGIFCLILKRLNPVISCALLLITIDVLDWIETLAGVLAIIFAFTGALPCALSFVISWGLTAIVKKYLTYIARFLGCLPNPWFRSSN